MITNTVDEIIEEIQTLSINQEDNYDNVGNSLEIAINWEDDLVFVKKVIQQDDYNEAKVLVIEKDYYENDENRFLKDLFANIKKFSLLNIHIAIDICDLKSSTIIFQTKRCQTFYDKILECTGLSALRIFNVLLPHYKAELYFYAAPLLQHSLDNLLILNGYYNTAAVNSLYSKMLQSNDKFSGIQFIGKINDENNTQLKKTIDLIHGKLVHHMEICMDNVEHLEEPENVVDLTSMLDEVMTDDDFFYDFNTSDIMETDECFYEGKSSQLRQGWDQQVDIDQYYNKKSHDDGIMQRFLKDLIKEDSTNEIQLIDDDDDELEVVKSDFTLRKSLIDNSDQINRSRRSTRGRPSNSHQRVKKTEFKFVPNTEFERNRAIKSNLFNKEQIAKWNKSGGMKEILSTSQLFDNNQDINKTLSIKIPKKIPSGPTVRKPIHQENKPSTSKNMTIFNKAISKILPYNSPSSHRSLDRSTPETVATFVNKESSSIVMESNSILIDDDDGDENNDQNNNISGDSQPKEIVRKKLLPNSIPTIFKHRKPSFSSPSSTFAPSGKNSSQSSRRKL